MNLLERLSQFNNRVKSRYKLGSQDNEREYYERYIRSNNRYDGAAAFDFNYNRDYICFYFEDFSTEEDKKQFRKDCVYTCLI
jgi:hypothetical protein